MAATRIVEGFSISHAAILDGVTSASLVASQLHDIYGVREGAVQVSSNQFDNTGDDAVLSTWSWFDFATLTVTSGYIPFSMVATLTGVTITSSGAGASTWYNLPLWTQGSLNQPRRPVLLRVPSKDDTGNVYDLDIVLYRVQFEPIAFDGPTYKSGVVAHYSGRALISSVDETGTSLGATSSTNAIGRLVSRTQA